MVFIFKVTNPYWFIEHIVDGVDFFGSYSVTCNSLGCNRALIFNTAEAKISVIFSKPICNLLNTIRCFLVFLVQSKMAIFSSPILPADSIINFWICFFRNNNKVFICFTIKIIKMIPNRFMNIGSWFFIRNSLIV